MPTPTSPAAPPALSPARSIALQRSISAAVAAFAALSLADTTEPAEAQQVIYVDDDAPPGGDGTSWETAYRAIYEGGVVLSGSAAFKDVEVRVAGGRYFVTDPIGGSRSHSLVLQSGVVIRGGFRGLTGVGSPFERDPDRFVTVIDGDIRQPGVAEDNSQTTILIQQGADALIDGLQFVNIARYPIRFLANSRGVVSSCVFKPGINRGRVCVYAANGPSILLIERCRFTDLDTGRAIIYGAGIEALLLRECEFVANAAPPGVVEAEYCQFVSIDGCEFQSNVLSSGSAIRVSQSGSADIRRTVVRGTTRSGVEGVAPVYLDEVGLFTISDCVISDNTVSTAGGGGLRVSDAAGHLERCVFERNVCGENGGAILAGSADVTLENCLIAENVSGDQGGGVFSASSRFRLVQCTVADNQAFSAAGAGLRLNVSESIVESSVVWGNHQSGQPPASQTFSTQILPANALIFSDSIVTGIVGGGGNLANDPSFVGGGDYRLRHDSPAIGLGHNPLESPVDFTTDLDGNPRVRGPFLDAGCYEAPADAACSPADLAGVAIRGLPGYRRPDDRLSTDDFFVFIEAYTLGDNAADLTATATPGAPGYGVPNGVLNTDDFLYYLALYAAGC